MRFAALIGTLLGTKSDEIPITRLPTNFAFIGLILGGLPAIYKRVNMKEAKLPGVILFLLFLALVVVLPLLNPPEARTVDHSIGTILLMIPLGAIASSTMVIPGVSGSMIMMLLGYYNPVINAMNDLRGGDWSSLASLLPLHNRSDRGYRGHREAHELSSQKACRADLLRDFRPGDRIARDAAHAEP